jgi:hypothetical protein
LVDFLNLKTEVSSGEGTYRKQENQDELGSNSEKVEPGGLLSDTDIVDDSSDAKSTPEKTEERNNEQAIFAYEGVVDFKVAVTQEASKLQSTVNSNDKKKHDQNDKIDKENILEVKNVEKNNFKCENNFKNVENVNESGRSGRRSKSMSLNERKRDFSTKDEKWKRERKITKKRAETAPLERPLIMGNYNKSSDISKTTVYNILKKIESEENKCVSETILHADDKDFFLLSSLSSNSKTIIPKLLTPANSSVNSESRKNVDSIVKGQKSNKYKEELSAIITPQCSPTQQNTFQKNDKLDKKSLPHNKLDKKNKTNSIHKSFDVKKERKKKIEKSKASPNVAVQNTFLKKSPEKIKIAPPTFISSCKPYESSFNLLTINTPIRSSSGRHVPTPGTVVVSVNSLHTPNTQMTDIFSNAHKIDQIKPFHHRRFQL